MTCQGTLDIFFAFPLYSLFFNIFRQENRVFLFLLFYQCVQRLAIRVEWVVLRKYDGMQDRSCVHPPDRGLSFDTVCYSPKHSFICEYTSRLYHSSSIHHFCKKDISCFSAALRLAEFNLIIFFCTNHFLALNFIFTFYQLL